MDDPELESDEAVDVGAKKKTRLMEKKRETPRIQSMVDV